VKRFYKRPAPYGLDVTPGWRGLFKYPPRTLIYLVSRHIRQLNLPTGSSRADTGMTSKLFRLSDPATGRERYACWLRRSKITGEVVYAEFYTSCKLPGREGRFVKVVFSLPGGSATVLLRPENRPDGSLALVSEATASAEWATTTSTGRRKVRRAACRPRLRLRSGPIPHAAVPHLTSRPLKRPAAAARLTGL
jgi:hypothetical protein